MTRYIAALWVALLIGVIVAVGLRACGVEP
jgi:hypothetical protein